MDLNNNDELELEIEIEDVPQVDVEDVPDVESGESNETTETIEVDELVVNDKIESGEISEEPDLILEDESEEVYLEETVEDAVQEVQIPSEEKKKGPEVIIPKNNIGNYEQWRNKEKRRSGIIISICAVVVIAAVIALVILVPKLFGKGEGTSASVAGEETTQVLTGDNGENASEATTEAPTEKATVADTVAPVIAGVKDKTFNIGDVVMYLSGVT
ncbi:MAG: hypothetical protein IJB96_02090, partial [Lachnospira sp.]|nr:hypothetical protein [Lachnospira sp.]